MRNQPLDLDRSTMPMIAPVARRMHTKWSTDSAPAVAAIRQPTRNLGWLNKGHHGHGKGFDRPMTRQGLRLT